MQLVVHTGSGFEGFTREQDLKKNPEIGPKLMGIPMPSKWVNLWKLCEVLPPRT